MNRQKELRNLLRKNKANKTLPSKLCEYNNKNQLICKICKTMVKSTTFWKTHERSTKHKQTLNHLLKLKAERDKNLDVINIDNNIDINGSKETQKNEIEKKEREKQENDEEILVDGNGIPLNFFDKSMQHKKPKHKKELKVEKNENHNHFIVVEKNKNKNKNKKIKLINENVDDTDKELLKLENDMKIEQNKKEDQLLEFVKEMDKKILNQENKEIQFKIDKIKSYRNSFKSYKKKRNFTELSNDKHVVTPNKKKRKITQKITEKNSDDSDFEENDIFDLGDWRTQKI